MEPATPSLQTDYAWTPRQREVLALIAAGRTNGEIAELLHISLSGAKWHVTEILSKLGVDSREEAARYWRRYNRPAQRVHRALRALTGVSLFAKAAAGTTGVFALGAATVISVGMLSSDGSNRVLAHTPGTPVADTAPQPECGRPPTPADYVIPAAASGTGYDVFAYAGAGSRGIMCVGAWKQVAGVTTGGLVIGGQDTNHMLVLPVDRSTDCTAALAGYVTGGAVAIHVRFADGTSALIAATATSPAMRADMRFFSAPAPCEPWPGHADSLDAKGNIIDSQDIPDPRAYNENYRSNPPVAADFKASGRGKPGGRGSSGSGAFAVGATASSYEFTVVHDGTLPLTIIPWCGTGLVPVTYASGPTDAGGSGVIRLDVPTGNAACFFLVTGADGAWSIHGNP